MSRLLSLLHRFLLLLPPEWSHTLGIWGLKAYQCLLCRRDQSSNRRAAPLIPGLPTVFKPTSKVGLGAGFDKNAEVFAALSTFGFGFIEVGTITPLPQNGNPAPRLWRMPGEALVNHMGFNSVGFEKSKSNIVKLRKRASCPIFANIGKNRNTPVDEAIEDYKTLFENLSDSVDGFVVNLSSPNTPGLRSLQNETFLNEIAKCAPSLPVFVKLAPDLENSTIKALGEYVERESRFSGIVLTNTSRALAEKEGMDIGGLSGRPLFSRALECVSLAREGAPTKTIIGVGGISSASDMKQMFGAGANLIEIYTAFIFQGPCLVSELRSSSMSK